MYQTIFSALLGFLLTAKVLPAQTSAPAQTPIKAVAAANNAFAGELYQRLKDGNGNIFFSPYSISSALTMTYQGAKGATAEEMAKVLQLPADNQTLNEGYTALNKTLSETDKNKGFELSLANALWGQTGEPFLPAFTENLKNNFGAGIEELDFRTAPEAARLKINAWVEGQTHDRIKNLLPPKSIDEATSLVLTNAIYFKGQWANKFDKELTKDGDFRTHLDGNLAKVPLMFRQGKYRYTEDEKCQALELPYVGGQLTMVVLLPKSNPADAVEPGKETNELLEAGRQTLEKAFTGEYLFGLMKQLTQREVLVTLPKWKMTQNYELKPALQKMGMKLAFEGRQADFSGMTGSKKDFISLVLHKAFVEVNEEGTEAAAATAVVMARGAAKLADTAKPVVFKADRVFLYVIVHKASGAILFAGRVADPTKNE